MGVSPATSLPAEAPVRLQFAGALHQDALYLERGADVELYRALKEGDWCYVLAPRQIGKSSLRVRTAQRLAQEGWLYAHLDLTLLGSSADRDPIACWYLSLAASLAGALSLPNPQPYFQSTAGMLPVTCFTTYLREHVMPAIKQPVTIFLDEIDFMRELQINRDEFFLAIRGLFLARAEDVALRRLCLCLLGTVSPRDLVENPQVTPFNIGRAIRLEDFSRAEISPLTPALAPLGGSSEAWLDAIYEWTAGHPYMTLALCGRLLSPRSRGAATNNPQGRVEQAVRELFLLHGRSSDPNLSYAERRLEQSPHKGELLSLYHRLLEAGALDMDSTDPIEQELSLCGMAAERDPGSSGERRLCVRNQIFARVFDLGWVREKEANREITLAVRRWQAAGRSNDAVLRGEVLNQALAWAERHRSSITQDENALLRASLQVAAAERATLSEARAARTLRRLVATLITLVIATMAMAVVAYWQRRAAKTQEQLARGAELRAMLEESRAKTEEAKARALAKQERESRLRFEESQKQQAKLLLRRQQDAELIAAQARNEATRQTQIADQQRKLAQQQVKIAEMAKAESERVRLDREADRKRTEERQKLEEAQRQSLRKAVALAASEEPQEQTAALEAAIQAYRTFTAQDKEPPADIAEDFHRALAALWRRVGRSISESRRVDFPKGTLNDAVLFAKDRRLIATGENGTASVWRVTPSQIEQREDLPWSSVSRITADGNTLIIRERTGFKVASLLSLSVGLEPAAMRLSFASIGCTLPSSVPAAGRANPAEAAGIRDIDATANGTAAVACSQGGVRLCHLRADGVSCQALAGPTQPLWTLSFAPEGKVLAGGDQQGGLWLWHAGTDGAMRPSRLAKIHRDRITVLSFSGNGELLLSGSRKEPWVVLWQTNSGQPRTRFGDEQQQRWGLQSAALSRSGHFAVTVSRDGQALLWEVGLLAVSSLGSVSSHSGSRVQSARFSDDSRHVVVAGRDDVVRLFPVDFEYTLQAACKLLHKLNSTSSVYYQTCLSPGQGESPSPGSVPPASVPNPSSSSTVTNGSGETR